MAQYTIVITSSATEPSLLIAKGCDEVTWSYSGSESISIMLLQGSPFIAAGPDLELGNAYMVDPTADELFYYYSVRIKSQTGSETTLTGTIEVQLNPVIPK